MNVKNPGVDAAARAAAAAAQLVADNAHSDASTADGKAVTADGKAVTAQAAAITAQNATIPNGRLFVPPAYYATAGAQTTTVNGTDDIIDFSWIQECDNTLTSLSIYIGSVSVQGNLNLSLCADSAGAAGTEIYAIGTLDSGAGAGWIRKVLGAAQQLYRNTRYHLTITGTAAKSYTIASRRNTGAEGSGYPGDVKSYTKLNGAGSWTVLTQDALDANFLVVLNSNTGHNPDLYYGQHNGQSVPIPGTGLLTIPPAGLSIATSGLTVSTLYYVYAYDNSGTLAVEASATVPVISGGLWVKTGATTRLLLGIFCTVAGPGSVVGPIDCGDWRGVGNVFNKIRKRLGKRLFATNNTSHTIASGWVVWPTTTDWRCSFVTWESSVYIEASAMIMGAYPKWSQIGIAMDSTTIPDGRSVGVGNFYNTYWPVSCQLNGAVDNGVHYAVPLVYGSDAAAGTFCQVYSGPAAFFAGFVEC